MNEKEKIPGRIKLARHMAKCDTQASLLHRIPDWKASRLGNYEAGVSTPGPDDVLKIANATETSPCWLMFGLGPIRSSDRDLQAIRHQNFSRLVDQSNGELAPLAKAMGLSVRRVQEYLDTSCFLIDDVMARRCESYAQHRHGWMDEQHVTDDPVCMAFPKEMRELMSLYSAESPTNRHIILNTLKALVWILAVKT